MCFLETIDVVKKYSGHTALDKVSIKVPENSVFGLLGPNGAGKTTLIRIINRITAPDAGAVLFHGIPSQPEDVYRIGYLPEERGLYRKMRAGEQAVYLARLKGLTAKEATARLKELFHRFDIIAWWNRRLEELSKGMQQKVQFITAIAHRPELLIFDEPFSGFDPLNAELIKNEILRLKSEGKTIIFSTHNMASVEELCDEIALIDHAKAVLSGGVAEIRSRFRQDIFRLKTENETLVSDDSLCKIIDRSKYCGAYFFRVKKHPAINNAEFITRIVKDNRILTFEEEIPSMNDVFIQTVNGAKDDEKY
ncbi:MAG: ATP-binding cassette domain-containing protein [Dysgonamonadaceae bacterium]|jgi:ABC-2 type transport system ATP-binding protein|nr:ATP-binding cassette domain-containing protein [Dysgonamonadaceae bacterium]